MDVMLVMDANMHLASLVNIPVVSIWGNASPVQALQDGISLRQNNTDRPCPAVLVPYPEKSTVIEKIMPVCKA